MTKAVYKETRLSAVVHIGKYQIKPHWNGLADLEEIRTMMRRFADGYNAEPKHEAAVVKARAALSLATKEKK